LTATVELTAGRIVAGGNALARADDGRVVLVEGALPGERVAVEITQDRRDLLKARATDVLIPSPARTEPPCVHAREGCGGCTWQHIRPSDQLALKLDIVRDALARIAKIEDAPLAAPVALPAAGYRTTVRALVVDGQPAFRRHQSHVPVMIDSCLVAHPLVDDVLQHSRFHDAREVVVRAGVRTGERSVLPVPARARIAVPDDVHVGPRAHIHEIVDGRTFRVSPQSFFQVRIDGAEALTRVVRDAVGPDRVVADLYAGVGLFAATLDTPARVIAVEQGRAAVADAKHNLREFDAHIVRTDVRLWRAEAADVVVADPPRTGLGPQGVTTVAACCPERVVLASCDAPAMARDVRLLGDRDFGLTEVTLVDLFPHTPHVECVAVLDRV
jgi:23S rRNA (uracil1939-C5)-methyltransferase